MMTLNLISFHKQLTVDTAKIVSLSLQQSFISHTATSTFSGRNDDLKIRLYAAVEQIWFWLFIKTKTSLSGVREWCDESHTVCQRHVVFEQGLPVKHTRREKEKTSNCLKTRLAGSNTTCKWFLGLGLTYLECRMKWVCLIRSEVVNHKGNIKLTSRHFAGDSLNFAATHKVPEALREFHLFKSYSNTTESTRYIAPWANECAGRLYPFYSFLVSLFSLK